MQQANRGGASSLEAEPKFGVSGGKLGESEEYLMGEDDDVMLRLDQGTT